MEMEPARMDAAPAMAHPVIPILLPPERRAMGAVMAGAPAAPVPMLSEAPGLVTVCEMAAAPAMAPPGPVRIPCS